MTERLSDAHWAELKGIVAEAARAHILPRFRALGPDQIEAKAHAADLVTIADREAEAAITRALRDRWPEALVIGEEAVSEGAVRTSGIDHPGRTFIIDPVDGTWNFAKGVAVFGVILALVENGLTTRGLLYDPLFDDWVEAGAGQGAWHRPPGRAPIRLEGRPGKGAPLSGFLPLNLLPHDRRGALAGAMSELGSFNSMKCSCHEYRMLALGHADYCLSGPVPNAWDHAAGALAVTEVGGVARMLDGRAYRAALTEGYLLTARSEAIWAEVAAPLQRVLSAA